jgi:hypothetical protein
MRIRAIEVPEEVDGLRTNEIDNGDSADGRDQPIDQGSSAVWPVVFKPDDEVKNGDCNGCDESRASRKENQGWSDLEIPTVKIQI